MKTLAWIFVLLGALIAAGPRGASATADGPDCFAVSGVAVDDVLNVRGEPSAKGAKVGEIPHDGRGIENLGCKGGPTFAEWQKMTNNERTGAAKKRWCRIKYKEVKGWVAGWFLSEDSCPPAKPQETRR